MKQQTLSFFSLFTSTATLLCCALPALLVVLGFGATFASLLSVFPQLIWLSENKLIVFLVSGLVIFSSHLLQRRSQNLDCPIDSKAQACATTRKSSKVILWIATVFWLIGFSFAYILPKFL